MGDEKLTEMPDLTPNLQQLTSDAESKIFGITIRAIGFIEIVSTICIMSVCKIKIDEPLYSIGTMAIGFYFGSKNSQMMQKKS